MSLPTEVKIVEVGPRDGLQNETMMLSSTERIAFIDRLSACGLKTIECGSFVSEKKVPQMQRTDVVLQGIKRIAGTSYPVLVPNMQGLEAAIKAGAKDIAIFASASETFSQRNINCSIADSIKRYQQVVAEAKQHRLNIRGYISCCLGCPYEGDIAVEQVLAVATELYQLGCYEISLGDTIGVGTALQAQRMVTTVANAVPIEKLAAHFHDTYNQALTNIFAVMQLGVAVVDSSVSGLGGCPYAKGASGNVATEDVLYLLNGLGITTGLDLACLIKAGRYICDMLQRPTQSKVARAMGATV